MRNYVETSKGICMAFDIKKLSFCGVPFKRKLAWARGISKR